MQNVNFKIHSIAPILFHNVNSMDLIKPKKMTHPEFEKSEEVFKARLYIEEDQITIPSRMISGLLKKAAQASGIKQDGKRSTYASLIRAVVFCLDPMILDQKLENVIEHKEYVSIQKNKILRIFPMLKEWSGKIKLTFDEKQISLEALEEIFNYGGLYCGFGDYRPQFGRFTVSNLN